MEVSLLSGGSKRTLETVKILHETVLALRTALEGSRKEIIQLRTQTRARKNDGLAGGSLLEAMDSPGKTAAGLEDEPPESGSESDDIDDIELVFTTGETDPGSIHEDLVPIVEEGRKSLSNLVLETDISKCGVLDENDVNLITRRNTLPNPLPYRPIPHREVLAASRGAPTRSPCKAMLRGTHETAAQTDITALPAQWKSETYLAHKMSYNLTTLPSKFTLPLSQIKRLPLSDKTREARRVLLSDINFTSMVPELSRSADHLHDEKTATNKNVEYNSPRNDGCFDCLRRDSRSSCCYVSSTSIQPLAGEEPRRRHSWRPPHPLCCHTACLWSSVPSSPIKCPHRHNSDDVCCHPPPKRRTKVRFHDPCGRSLPNLRPEGDSGDSTDSLLDEAEEFLRRSIDSMLISRTPLRRRDRKPSEANYISGFEPPRTAQPFLPKSVKDLQEGCFVKVIAPGGRIAVGKLRYAGQVQGQGEDFVGVELGSDSGFSDGGFMGQRLFECGTNHAVFVPFRKVVIAWDV